MNVADLGYKTLRNAELRQWLKRPGIPPGPTSDPPSPSQ